MVTEVIDTGVGIKAEDLEKLFKNFGKLQSTHQINEQGMGLGLTISKGLTQKLGGNTQVSSVYGSGSIFEFSIKFKASEQEEEEEEKKEKEEEEKEEAKKDENLFDLEED